MKKEKIIIPQNLKICYIKKSYENTGEGLINFYSINGEINGYDVVITIEEELDEYLKEIDVEDFIEFYDETVVIDEDILQCVDETTIDVFEEHREKFERSNDNNREAIKEIERLINKKWNECIERIKE